MLKSSYCLARQKSNAQSDAANGGYKPCWMIMLRMAGQPRRCLSSKVMICDDCLAVPAGQSPTKVRPRCKCTDEAHRYARELQKTEGELWLQGRTEDLVKLRAPRQRLRWGRVFEQYLKTGPDDRVQRIKSLRTILEVPTGRAAEDLFVSDWKAAEVRLWARMWQEYARRGWTKRGAAPADAWEKIRAMGDQLPLLDYKTVSPANTTIRSYLRDAKSVIGRASRNHYLVDLADEIPRLPEIEELQILVPMPDSRVQIDPEVYAKMWEAKAKLKEVNPKLWLCLDIFWRTGLRPIELRQVKGHWLEEELNHEGEVTRTVLVIKNRPEEGFMLKSWRANQVRVIPISAEALAVIDEVKLPGGSIFGVANATQADFLTRSSSEWIRKFVPKGPFTNTLLRKQVGTVRLSTDGAASAAAGLGHSTTRTTEGYYATNLAQVRELTDEDLAPGMVVGKLRRVRGA